MKITTRGRYGLRAILGLARNYGSGPTLVSTLADNERLSRKYLHALLAALQSAGLVQGVRGVGGGFELSRPPWTIRLNDVLRAVEGPLSLVDCVDQAGTCGRSGHCTTRRLWQKLSTEIESVLKGVSLQDLLAMEAFPADTTPIRKRKSPARSRASHSQRSATGRGRGNAPSGT